MAQEHMGQIKSPLNSSSSQERELPLAPVEEAIEIVDGAAEAGPSQVKAMGTLGAAENVRKTSFNRPVNLTGQGATRCKVFHSKIATASLEHMESIINEWIDSDKIEVKHVGHVIGLLEGKRPEPNMVVMVWY